MTQPAPFLLRVPTYAPGDQPDSPSAIKLNTNEFPYPPAPEVLEAIRAAANEEIRKYPASRCDELRERLGEHYEVSPARIFVGNGSDEILRLIIQAYGGEGRTTVAPEPTYSLYETLVLLGQGHLQSIPAEEFGGGGEAAGVRADLMLVCNPNPPIGTIFSEAEVRKFAEATELLVLDEAYGEFADGVDGISLAKEAENIAVTRTFSKAYGLAGMRVGYVIGPLEVIATLDKMADSYNVSRTGQAAAIAALAAQDYYRGKIEQIKADRAWLSEELRALGFDVAPSGGNFIFARHEKARALYEALRGREIYVRYFDKPGLDDGLRITVGTRAELDALVQGLRAEMAEV